MRSCATNCGRKSRQPRNGHANSRAFAAPRTASTFLIQAPAASSTTGQRSCGPVPGAVVHITEGANKSADLNEAGHVATAVAYHQWTPECINALAGCHLIIHEDHNPKNGGDPGPRLAADARNKLAPRAAAFAVPASHLWKYLPPGSRGIERGDDIKDWLTLDGDPTKLLEICYGIRPRLSSRF